MFLKKSFSRLCSSCEMEIGYFRKRKKEFKVLLWSCRSPANYPMNYWGKGGVIGTEVAISYPTNNGWRLSRDLLNFIFFYLPFSKILLYTFEIDRMHCANSLLGIFLKDVITHGLLAMIDCRCKTAHELNIRWFKYIIYMSFNVCALIKISIKQVLYLLVRLYTSLAALTVIDYCHSSWDICQSDSFLIYHIIYKISLVLHLEFWIYPYLVKFQGV